LEYKTILAVITRTGLGIKADAGHFNTFECITHTLLPFVFIKAYVLGTFYQRIAMLI
jgi:hypothetical protein